MKQRKTHSQQTNTQTEREGGKKRAFVIMKEMSVKQTVLLACGSSETFFKVIDCLDPGVVRFQ